MSSLTHLRLSGRSIETQTQMAEWENWAWRPDQQTRDALARGAAAWWAESRGIRPLKPVRVARSEAELDAEALAAFDAMFGVDDDTTTVEGETQA